MLPSDLRRMLDAFNGDIYIAGGAVGALQNDLPVKDYDLFVCNPQIINEAANFLEVLGWRKNTPTKNAITFKKPGLPTVQIITRWVYPTVWEGLQAFDFTCTQQAITNSALVSLIGAAEAYKQKVLQYTEPERKEGAAGSFWHMYNYAKKGFTITPDDAARIIARFTPTVSLSKGRKKKAIYKNLCKAFRGY